MCCGSDRSRYCIELPMVLPRYLFSLELMTTLARGDCIGSCTNSLRLLVTPAHVSQSPGPTFVSSQTLQLHMHFSCQLHALCLDASSYYCLSLFLPPPPDDLALAKSIHRRPPFFKSMPENSILEYDRCSPSPLSARANISGRGRGQRRGRAEPLRDCCVSVTESEQKGELAHTPLLHASSQVEAVQLDHPVAGPKP